MADISPPPASPPIWPGWPAATARCIRFYSRLPLPALPGESDIHAAPDFRLILRALPLAGVAISLPAAFAVVASGLAGLGPTLSAALAISALVLTCGGLHEDGLADSADGLFGGHGPEARLAIMKDSRIGSYGALALCLSLLLRVTALASIIDAAGMVAGATAIVLAAIVSRTGGIVILHRLAPARPDGASAAVGRPEPATVRIGLGLAAALAALIGLAGVLPPFGVVLGIVLAAVAVKLAMRLAWRLIGGQTGDIIGAGQQLAEIAVYVGLAIGIGSATA